MRFLFILFQYCCPQHLISRLIGKLAASEKKSLKTRLIDAFMCRYDINLDEAEFRDPAEYCSFNHFFTRALAPGARPIDEGNTLVSPADGAFSQLGKIENGRIFQAKGHSFNTDELLANSEHAKHFSEGEFATIYLSPRDYHRVHMPLTGKLKSMTFIPGDLFSVNQTTAASVPRLFARNERLVAMFDTETGPMAMVLVGAMIVASIETVWHGNITPASSRHIEHWDYSSDNITLEKGSEMGRFKLGSTVVLLLPKDSIEWNQKSKANSAIKLGESIASLS